MQQTVTLFLCSVAFSLFLFLQHDHCTYIQYGRKSEFSGYLLEIDFGLLSSSTHKPKIHWRKNDLLDTGPQTATVCWDAKWHVCQVQWSAGTLVANCWLAQTYNTYQLLICNMFCKWSTYICMHLWSISSCCHSAFFYLHQCLILLLCTSETKKYWWAHGTKIEYP